MTPSQPFDLIFIFFPEAAQMIRRQTGGLAVFPHHIDMFSLRTCAPSLAFEPNCGVS